MMTTAALVLASSWIQIISLVLIVALIVAQGELIRRVLKSCNDHTHTQKEVSELLIINKAVLVTAQRTLKDFNTLMEMVPRQTAREVRPDIDSIPHRTAQEVESSILKASAASSGEVPIQPQQG